MTGERRLTVCLSFDFDAMSVWICSGSRNPAEISRGEFGAVAVGRILALLARHGVRATFFVPGHTALAYPDVVRRIVAEGHEVGHHGWVHENPADFDREGEVRNFRRALDALDRVGVRPVDFRSPAADMSVHTIDVLLEHGIAYDSSCQGSDFVPYYLRQGDRWSTTEPYEFGRSVDLVEMPFSWLLDDFPHLEFEPGFAQTLASPRSVLETWRAEFDYALEHAPGGVFDLCLHPQVIGRGSRLTALEELVRHMSDAGAAFSTMADYASSWRSANPLPEWLAGTPPQAGRSA